MYKWLVHTILFLIFFPLWLWIVLLSPLEMFNFSPMNKNRHSRLNFKKSCLCFNTIKILLFQVDTFVLHTERVWGPDCRLKTAQWALSSSFSFCGHFLQPFVSSTHSVQLFSFVRATHLLVFEHFIFSQWIQRTKLWHIKYFCEFCKIFNGKATKHFLL